MRAMRMVALLMLVAVATPAPSEAGQSGEPKDPLARGRLLYNERKFVEAVAAAEEARLTPARADSADLIAARAYLERYRESGASDDLTNGRDRLRRIDPARFSATERSEFIVGLGEALFFDGAPGAAADVFASVLDPGSALPPDARERVLDWWASALDREAQPRSELERQAVYQKVRDRMRQELSENAASATAGYWLSAAARGQGDLEAAWTAAQAAWVRAPLAADRGAALRGDLDMLVTKAIVPERARVLAQPQDAIRQEWETFKSRWENQ
jgi:hypothetical protein